MLRALGVGALLVVVLTAPTLTRPTTVGRVDTNDGRYSIWNVAWIDHALLTDPAHLLDANIFWPHRGTLAYSELNLVAGLFGLPWYAATGNPLAALNGAAATALLLCFVCTWALVRRLTGSDAAGLVSAVAFTFCPYVSSVTPHIQLLMVFAFPLVLLAFHRAIERPGIGRGIQLGLALAVAALACGYYGVFVGCALALMTLWFAERRRAYWIAVGSALVTTAVAIAPVYLAFNAARAASGATFGGHADELPGWSANLASYLASGAAAHEWWLPALARWQRWVDPLFPGVLTLVLAVAGLVAVWRLQQSRDPDGRPVRRVAAAYGVLAIAAIWASFGPAGGLYPVLDAVVPGMHLLRAPSRFGVVAIFALTVLAGFGVAAIERRRRWLPMLLIVLVAAELSVRTEAWGWPSWPLRRVPPLSPAYQALATLPRGVLVEYQFPYERSNYHNHATAMFWSTYHWQPLLNGYSDVIPPDFDEIALPVNGFPDPASFAIMHARDVRYVLWHVDYYQGDSRRVLEARLARYAEYLRPIVKTPEIWLYEIVRWP